MPRRADAFEREALLDGGRRAPQLCAREAERGVADAPGGDDEDGGGGLRRDARTGVRVEEGWAEGRRVSKEGLGGRVAFVRSVGR